MRLAHHEEPDEPRGRAPAWLLDLLLGVAVTLIVALVISSRQGGGRSPDALTYVLGGSFGALMLVRRRYPVGVLVITMLLLFGYYALDYPAIGLAVPVSAALYSAAERGRRGWAIAVSITLVVVSTYYRLDEASIAFLGYETVSTVTLLAAAIALGDGARSSRALQAAQRQQALLIAQEHASRTEQRVQAERLRIARELHDSIGHSVAVISLQSHVAREAVGVDDAQVRQAIAHIQTAVAATMRELRGTLRLLRSPAGDPETLPPSSLANLPALLESATASGLRVDARVSLDIGALPATVDAAAYRIVQEALTNVLRHAAASRVELEVTADAHALRLRVADDGRASGGDVAEGSGIAGMRERARLLGGTLAARPLPARGFEVSAALPLTEEP